MKRNEINGYQPKELVVADVIAYMRDRDKIRITDLRILNEVFFGYVCDLKSYPEDEKIKSILESEISWIGTEITMGTSMTIYIRSNDDGKFDVDYLIRRLKNMETKLPTFFDQMITYQQCPKKDIPMMKDIVKQFKELGNLKDVNIDQYRDREPICPFHPISENPGESHLLTGDIVPRIPSLDKEIIKNPENADLKITVIKKREKGDKNDNQ